MKKLVILLIALATSACLAQEHHHAASTTPLVGTVNFPTSCSPSVKDSFNTAVALLHSFEYDTAREAFLKVAAQDPNCAMARWGTAMTYFHGAWGEMEQGPGAEEAALAREIASRNPATTAREKQYIAAVSAIYAESDAPVLARSKAFVQEMAKVHADNPQDDEASIFYAVSLFISSGRDKSYANQRQCGEILQPLFKKYPNHPGIAHYIIHCYDNPALAQEGLSAAREYAKIAPDSAHATHMPSHIFVRLGLWQETVQSNIASMNVAAHETGECHGRGSALHAMHFLQFAYLQLGMQAKAKKVAEDALALPTDGPQCSSGKYVAASYALQAHDWEMANHLSLDVNNDDLPSAEVTWTAIGLAAARTGDMKRAQRALTELAALRDLASKKVAAGANSPYEASRLDVEAWIAQSQGDSTKALELMRRADEIGGYPTWAQPIPAEHLGDLLLEQHKPAEALASYRKALDNTANLFNAMYGAASAAAELKDTKTAQTYYEQLLNVAGDGDRAELGAIRKNLVARGN